MLTVSDQDIVARIARDNPWWGSSGADINEAHFPKRIYFTPFADIALNFRVKRAAILLGPRRVGKTVIIKQLVHHAIETGVHPENILYASIDTPIYAGMPLETFTRFLPKKDQQKIILFDEIQYLKDWGVHLKDLVDSYPSIKFVATGSAAAALRLKSRESGAGRFSEFILPPLTFFEFLEFAGRGGLVNSDMNEEGRWHTRTLMH